MNQLNMTGDPNQQNPSSVFGFDSYPYSNSGATPIDWAKVTLGHEEVEGNPTLIDQQFDAFRNGPQSTQNPYLGSYGSPPPISGNFSFGLPEHAPSYPVQFPFPSGSNMSSNGFIRSMQPSRGKRKTDSPPLQPLKQHITEEKMAEHMSKLHISSETEIPNESELNRTKRLYMCEEMRKLQNDSILPQTLLNRLHRPCTALVLWTPPPRLLPVINNQQIENDIQNNNEENVPDRMENEPPQLNNVMLVANDMEFDA